MVCIGFLLIMIGKTALVWEYKDSDTMGEFLEYWECLDTGCGADSDGDGIGSIQEGRVYKQRYDPFLSHRAKRGEEKLLRLRFEI